MQDRFAIANQLRTVARLLQIKGENRFKTLAFNRAAGALENLQGDFDAVVKNRRLKQIPGIGETLASLIEEIYSSGECSMLQRLRDELPPGAVELSEIPGLSLKKIAALHERLGIESVADLKAACEENLVGKIKGFGAKSEAALRAAIDKFERRDKDFLLLNHADEQAGRILSYLRTSSAVLDAAAAGTLRRRHEIVRRIPIVVASHEPTVVLNHFLAFPALAHTDELEERRCLARLAEGVAVELSVVPPENYLVAFHSSTGSPEHVAKLRDLSHARGVSRVGGAENHSVESEHDIYRRLGLQYIPPELREDGGEIEAAAKGVLARLVAPQDMRGMTHCHTEYSDGRNSIEEMALAAQARGMSYLTITDHSQSAHYARGLSIDRLLAQWDEIARVQERVTIRLLKGIESDILEDGSLDYPDHLLARFDVIIASIHARHKMDSDRMTQRLLRALKLPLFKIWGHPLGRLIPSRPPFTCRMEELLDAAAAAPCAIEINGDPRRLDLEPRWIRAARARGIKFVVSTDAHSTAAMAHVTYGLSMARRGWLTPDEVLNTRAVEDFMRAVHP